MKSKTAESTSAENANGEVRPEELKNPMSGYASADVLVSESTEGRGDLDAITGSKIRCLDTLALMLRPSPRSKQSLKVIVEVSGQSPERGELQTSVLYEASILHGVSGLAAKWWDPVSSLECWRP